MGSFLLYFCLKVLERNEVREIYRFFYEERSEFSMKYTYDEIRNLYDSYDEVIDRTRVLNTIIRSPESTFGQVDVAKRERNRLIPRKRELDKEIDLVEKFMRLDDSFKD